MKLPSVAHNTHVLIVEDEAIVAADLESCLVAMGYTVSGIADNGPDALALVTARPPDVALVDIRLRGDMDGIELAHRLSAEHGIPVIFATAHADLATVQRASASEPFGYVIKPFDEQSLHIALEVACSRRAAEQRAKQVERWLSTMLHSIGDAVIATDRAGGINLMNPRAEALTEWSAQAARGRPLSDVFAISREGEPQLLTRVLGDVLERGSVLHLQGDVWLRTRSGVLLPIDDSIAPMRDERGLVTGLVVVFRDRTSLLEAERERRCLEEKMHEAQRLESLGVLSGGIAHDFNNLLTVTFGNAGLCRAKLPPDSELQPLLAHIEQAARRGADLCSQMLAYAGKGQFAVGPVDLEQLVRETTELLQVSVSKQATFALDLGADVPLIVGDASKLQQVVMNLVINASEALENACGTITLRIRTTELEAEKAAALQPENTLRPGRYVVLEVEDNGHGIGEEARQRIFDPFFTTKFQGRGLGLAAVRGIMTSHGGGIEVRSAFGVGTSFRLYFPLSGRVEARPAPDLPVPAPVTWNGRVLLADDEEAIRLLSAASLRELGFTVDACGDGQDAVAHVERNPERYRAALLDVTMPKLGGLAAARRIRGLHPTLPVILMSGYNACAVGEGPDLQQFVFLAKPFALDQLRQAIGEAFGRPAASHELTRAFPGAPSKRVRHSG